MDTTAAEIPLLPSISELASHYDLWLCDVWGVIHNGERAFAAAGDACRRFREQGGTVVLISNSPRPGSGVARQLDGLGVVREGWDAIVTSGDVTRSLLEQNRDKTLFHLGPDRDKGVFESLDLTFAPAEEAELVICSGLLDDETETPDDYAELLGLLAQRGLPMICANPDLMVERGHRLIYCAGALAAAYEALGGAVTYAGKPHPPIYERALAQAALLRGNPVGRERVLAIGDGLKTDMAGAAEAGVDALFVASGLHLAARGGDGSADAKSIRELFTDVAIHPIAAQARLVW
jgi:HAD superfamily hydrolase (TIGR01459 family)